MEPNMKLNKKETIVTFFYIAICIVLLLLPTGFEKAKTNSHHAKGEILEVVADNLQVVGIFKVGSQELNVRLVSGVDKGTEIKVINQMTGKLEFDEYYQKGEKLLVEYRDEIGGVVGYARGHYRLGLELFLTVLFAIFLCCIAGWIGFRSMLSFVFSALMIWKVMIPLFMKNIDPVLVSAIVVSALTASISFLVGGVNKRGLVAFSGACSGLLFACLLAFLFSRQFHIHGAVRPFAESLLYSGYSNLDITRIFICGIFIACSGAVMDLAMDISASMDELINKKPDIKFIEHVRSGLRIGRPVIGTMTTTLLLAYSGSYTFMMMYFVGQGTPLCQILNLNYVSSEVLNIMIGSFGITAVAPFTAIIAGCVYHKNNKK